MKSSKTPGVLPPLSPPLSASSSVQPFSKTPPTFKTKQAEWDSIASQFGLPLSSELTGLPPQVFPKFPTVAELAASSDPAPSPRPTGLFEELLQSRPEHIYLDVQDHPEKYEDGVSTLVTDLVQRKRELGADERVLLDRAVISYLEKPKVKPAARAKVKMAASPADEAMPAVEDFNDAPSGPDPAATQGDDPPAFWWV